MRVTKEAEIRMNEILDAAEELFGQKGFDGTSTNDIMEKVGIARGTLYYHFKRKEDIMDALIERKNHHILDAARRIAEDGSIPVIERMMHAILALNVSDATGQAMMEQMHKPQNALLHQKTQRAIINGVPPILAGIIREGIEQGLFSTPFPYESIEMIVVYANAIFDEETVFLTEEERESRIQAFLFNAGRLLGIQSESMADLAQVFGADRGGERG